jgi:hypothetical protein
MTEQKLDRPVALKRPPRPSPDEKVDPIPVPDEPAKKPRQRKVVDSATKTDYLEAAPKQREVVFPLSTRMGQLPTRVLEAEVRRTGKTVRVVVEEAIMLAYGQDGKQS